MENSLGREFYFFSLLKFAFPTTVMMLFMSLYTIVDGVFVSRFVGTDALSAVNIAYPVINVVIAFGVMLATGGSAVIARKLGEGKTKEARQDFSLLILFGVAGGLLFAAAGLFFSAPLSRLMGASEELLPYCRTYLTVLCLFAPAGILQMLFQSFFVTAGRPGLGLWLTVLAGGVNAVLDYLFIVPLGMGIAGAALATAAGYMVPAAVGVCFFFGKKRPLHFTRPALRWRVLRESCLNGSSEMVTNLSSAVITFLFNRIMMGLLGADGVAAVTIVLYAQFLLTALYMGFSMGVAPVVSYHYGAGNHGQLKRIFRICIGFIAGSSLLVFLCAVGFAPRLVGIFSPKGTAVYDIAYPGFLLFSLSYLFAGVNIFASAFFTALSNGRISAVISFLRTFAFILTGLTALPLLLGEAGVWLAVPLAEALTLFFSLWFLIRRRHFYRYG